MSVVLAQSTAMQVHSQLLLATIQNHFTSAYTLSKNSSFVVVFEHFIISTVLFSASVLFSYRESRLLN